MSRRSRGAYAELASPLLVGAATTLITIVAVFLSYNANQGLPFVPTYDVAVQVPDAQELVPGNEVLIGGHRAGVISGIDARSDRRGRTRALLSLKLDFAVKPIRDDSKVTVRPRSPLGLKYLQLEPGRNGKPLPAGGVLPLSRAQPIVDLDEVVDELDAPTRRNLQRVLTGVGTGLAGRGASLNRALERFRPFLRDAGPVLSDLADPRTRVGELVAAAARAAGELAPVSESLAALFASGETTLAAIERAGPALEETLAEAPPTLEVSTGALASLRPVLARARRLSGELAPAAQLLPATSVRVARALETGTPVLDRALRLASDLDAALEQLRRLAADAPAEAALRKLDDAAEALRPAVDFLAPYQLTCNYLGLWARNVASVVSEGDTAGTWMRFEAVGQPAETLQSAEPAPELHHNPYPHGAAPGQPAECEAGNEPYEPGRQLGNPAGNQGTSTEDTGAGG